MVLWPSISCTNIALVVEVPPPAFRHSVYHPASSSLILMMTPDKGELSQLPEENTSHNKLSKLLLMLLL